MIVIDKLTKAFGSNKVVDGADTQFEKGKVTSIIGPNGAGKSTLLSMASRLTERDGGSVMIDCKEIAEWDTKELAKKAGGITPSKHDYDAFYRKRIGLVWAIPLFKRKLVQR